MERHGFVTFWLILIISVNIFSSFYNIHLIANYNFNLSLGISLILLSICSCIAIILIFNWINGFWLFLVVQIIAFIIHITQSENMLTNASNILSCLIFFGILNIKKNGISTWNYLTGKHNEISKNNENEYTPIKIIEEKNISDVKKCPFCAEEIKKEAILCRYCGKDLPNEDKKIIVEEENIVKNEILEDKDIEIERLEKLFDVATDENEKGILAQKLYALGKQYYWRFIPRVKK